MSVIWLNGTIGSGKSAVGKALADLLPNSRFMDGDNYAGQEHLGNARRWRIVIDALLQAIVRRDRILFLIIAYPLDYEGFCRLRATCRKAQRELLLINLAPPLLMTLKGRGGRILTAWERDRIRVMRSEGYHRRPFAAATLPNVQSPVVRTAQRIARLRHAEQGPVL
jgi:hypothetical protein